MKKNLMKEIKNSWVKTKKSESGNDVKSNIKAVIEKYDTKIKKV